MLQSSVLGKIYGVWLNCKAFLLLQAVFCFFSDAFSKCAFRRFITREPVIERAYSRALFTRVTERAGGVFFSAGKGICRALSRLGSDSFTCRAVRLLFGSSVIFNFELFLGGFIFVMFAAPHESWSNTYAFFGAAALLFMLLLLSAAGRRPVLRFSGLGLPFLLFAIACCFSVFFSRDRGDTLRVLMFYISAFILMYVVSADLTDERRLFRLMGYIWLAVVFTSVYAILQRFAGVAVSSSLTDLATNKGVPGRVYSTLDNSNNFAEFLVLFTPLAAAFSINVKNPALRVAATCLMALPFISLIMTYSRSGWVSMLIAAAVFLYFANKKIIPLILLACIAVIPVLPDSVHTRFASLFSSRDTSINHRLYVWWSVVKMARDYWPTGIGLGPESFAEVYPPYAHIFATNGVPHAHMLWLEIIIETGVVGLISFLWLMLRSVKDAAVAVCARAGGVTRYALIAAAASFTGIAFAASAEYIWYYPRVLFAFFILLGVCRAASRIQTGRQ